MSHGKPCPECHGSGWRRCGMDMTDPVSACFWCDGLGYLPEPPSKLPPTPAAKEGEEK